MLPKFYRPHSLQPCHSNVHCQTPSQPQQPKTLLILSRSAQNLVQRTKQLPKTACFCPLPKRLHNQTLPQILLQQLQRKPQNSAPPGQDEAAPLFILQLGTAEVEYTQAPPPSTTEAENSHPHSLNPVPNGQTIPAQVNSQRLHYADFLFAGSMPKSSYLRAAEAKKQPEPAPVHSPAEDAALKKEKAQQERLRIETIYERMRVERKLHEAKRLAIIADLQTELQRIWREVILRRQKAEDDYHKSWQKVFLGVS